MVWLVALIFAGVVVYGFIDTGQAFRVGGAVQVWSGILLKDASVMPPVMQWVPLLSALMLAFSQFAPEMASKRLKLTLHLPLAETKIMSAMLCYGLAVLVVVYLLAYIVLLTGLSLYYPSEVLMLAFLKSIPWFLGGLAGYLLASWICLEPVWRRRICNSVIAAACLSLFFIDAISGAYVPLLPWLAAIIVSGFSFPFYSACRFKEGRQ